MVRHSVFHRRKFYFTRLTPSSDGTYVSACSNFRPVHSEVRQFASVRAFSPYPVFQPRDISVGIPFFFSKWLQPSFCRIYLYFTPHDPVSHDARRSIGGMVSGYMVPSFPSSVVKLRLHLVTSCISHCLVLMAELVVLSSLVESRINFAGSTFISSSDKQVLVLEYQGQNTECLISSMLFLAASISPSA
jgi:hypothetical protein